MTRTLKLGLNVGYWAGGPPPGAAESVLEADRLGFDSVWSAEAYGSDALMPLAWWGAATEGVKLGTAIVQISARTPAATAMAAMTLDHLSGGRVILGLGRAAHADRAQGGDPPRPRGLAGIDCHHAADRRGPGHAAHRGRARPGLNPTQPQRAH